jgi:uncharacterized protein
MEQNYRRCISCRITAPKAQFLSVVREPNGSIAINRGAGRSAYICLNSDCVSLAQKKKRLERALKAAVSPELYAEILSYLIEHSEEQSPR